MKRRDMIKTVAATAVGFAVGGVATGMAPAAQADALPETLPTELPMELTDAEVAKIMDELNRFWLSATMAHMPFMSTGSIQQILDVFEGPSLCRDVMQRDSSTTMVKTTRLPAEYSKAPTVILVAPYIHKEMQLLRRCRVKAPDLSLLLDRIVDGRGYALQQIMMAMHDAAKARGPYRGWELRKNLNRYVPRPGKTFEVIDNVVTPWFRFRWKEDLDSYSLALTIRNLNKWIYYGLEELYTTLRRQLADRADDDSVEFTSISAVREYMAPWVNIVKLPDLLEIVAVSHLIGFNTWKTRKLDNHTQRADG